MTNSRLDLKQTEGAGAGAGAGEEVVAVLDSAAARALDPASCSDEGGAKEANGFGVELVPASAAPAAGAGGALAEANGLEDAPGAGDSPVAAAALNRFLGSPSLCDEAAAAAVAAAANGLVDDSPAPAPAPAAAAAAPAPAEAVPDALNRFVVDEPPSVCNDDAAADANGLGDDVASPVAPPCANGLGGGDGACARPGAGAAAPSAGRGVGDGGLGVAGGRSALGTSDAGLRHNMDSSFERKRRR